MSVMVIKWGDKFMLNITMIILFTNLVEMLTSDGMCAPVAVL